MIRDLNLDKTLFCGQCFRWDKIDDTYVGVVNDKVYRIKEDSNIPNSLHNYFDFDLNYSKVNSKLRERNDLILNKAIEESLGLRILKQDFWETILSYIISQNNNIPRIKNAINKISSMYGDKLEEGFYMIPEAKTLAKLEIGDLSEIRLGYRAEYIIEMAKKYVELEYDKFGIEKFYHDRDMLGLTSNEYLMSFKGIGPKVSNCITLFSLNELNSFPIDVWVKRVMEELYGITNKKEMEEYAKDKFSPYGGIAQEYLFYYIRNLHQNDK